MARTGVAPVIGVVGGVASGKSLVSRCLERLGAVRIDADQIGHQVLEEPAVRQALTDRWGIGIVGPDGQVDRRRIAERVFGGQESGSVELAWLESVTHPRIAEQIERRIEQVRGGSPLSPVVLDAAVLLKAGWHRFCDRLLFVDVPAAVRQERAAGRGWSADQWRVREAAQGDLQAARAQADFVVHNSGSQENTCAQVRRIWQAVTHQGGSA